jgi:hypothetical protein
MENSIRYRLQEKPEKTVRGEEKSNSWWPWKGPYFQSD